MVIEVKSIEKDLNKCDETQLFNYVSRLNAFYGVLTNGHIWQIRDRDGIVIKSIDLINSENEKIESFFRCFNKNDFCKAPKKDSSCCVFMDWNQPFYIKEGDSLIKESCPTDTFVEFIIKHIDIVFTLQQNNRFEKIVVSADKNDFYTKKNKLRETQKIKYQQRTLYITKDHNTYFKRFVIQQIIVEGNINATIEPQLP